MIEHALSCHPPVEYNEKPSISDEWNIAEAFGIKKRVKTMSNSIQISKKNQA